jgi:hypothetical protein
MASSDDFPTSTAPISVNGFGLALGHESLAWDVSSPNQCFNADLWSNPSPNEHEGSDTHEALGTNTQSADSSRGDHSDRPGTEEAALACITNALHEAADGLEAPTAPIERREVLVKGEPWSFSARVKVRAEINAKKISCKLMHICRTTGLLAWCDLQAIPWS